MMSLLKKSPFLAYLLSSIGRKQVVSVTGLFMLLGFLIPHLGGNVLFFFGRDIYNAYAHHLHQLEAVLKGMEVVLLAVILVHILTAASLVIENFRSRGKRYSKNISTKKRTLGSRTMPWTGGMIFVFIGLHLLTFKYAQCPLLPSGDKDIYLHVMQLFGNPIWGACYLVFLMTVGLHVSHGFQSALQSFGLIPIRYRNSADRISLVLGVILFVFFGLIPIVAFYKGISPEDEVLLETTYQAPILQPSFSSDHFLEDTK